MFDNSSGSWTGCESELRISALCMDEMASTSRNVRCYRSKAGIFHSTAYIITVSAANTVHDSILFGGP